MHRRTNVKNSNSKVHFEIFKAFNVQNSCKPTENVDRVSLNHRLRKFEGCSGEIHSMAGNMCDLSQRRLLELSTLSSDLSSGTQSTPSKSGEGSSGHRQCRLAGLQ